MAAMRDRGQIALLGPSVVRHRSKCDRDMRNLAEMLAESSHRTVTDLSYPGQPLASSLQIATAEAAHGKARDIVLVITHDGLVGWPTPSYPEWIFFRLISPDARPAIGLRWSGLAEGLLGMPNPADLAFAYKGIAYPDQRVMHAEWFEPENANFTCPETITHDWNRLKAYTWFRQIENAPNPAFVEMLAQLNDYVLTKDKRLYVVMLPVNEAIFGQLNPTWPALIRNRTQDIIAELKEYGVSVMDLSRSASADEFSTVWCVCTHFNQTGRRNVAAAIASLWVAPDGTNSTSVVENEEEHQALQPARRQ